MKTLCDASRSILVVIDLQEKLMPAIHDGASVVQRALVLSQAARLMEVPVIGTAQNPERLGPNLRDVHALCNPMIAKNDFDACAKAGFLSALDTARDDLIILGCEAHVCVLQTVLGLLRRNRRVRVAADAVGSRRLLDRDIALQRMQAAGAELVTSEMVMFEWMRSCTHPRFREVLKLIK